MINKDDIPKLKLITTLLELSKNESKSDYIDIAKGRHKIPRTFKDIIKTAKRIK